MNELVLFAGAGGGILGSVLLGHRVVCAVEIDAYCREVLMARQEDGTIPPFPIWDDVRTFDGKPWRGIVDVVSAGFPCQPFSVAGKQRGSDDERNMWPETIRILREVRPRFALLENVPGLISCGYIGRVLGDLAESGFDCEWGCLSAAGVGAPHIRRRLWILAYARCRGDDADQQECQPWGCGASVSRSGGEVVADAICAQRRTNAKGRDVTHRDDARRGKAAGWTPQCRWWESEPDVGRVAHGVAHRMDRLRALGNGQVPGVVREAWLRLMRRMGAEGGGS